jgi:hypothetical protein
MSRHAAFQTRPAPAVAAYQPRWPHLQQRDVRALESRFSLRRSEARAVWSEAVRLGIEPSQVTRAFVDQVKQ